MIQTYHHGRFELFVVIIVIAIIALAVLNRYASMAEDARISRLEIISHHFMTGAANTRVQFLIANIASNQGEKNQLDLAGQTFYFSAQGWPAAVTASAANNNQPSDEDCYQLWKLFLQNPAPITKGEKTKNRKEFRVFAQANNCRYEFTDGSAYFDYYPLDGRLIFTPKT